MGRQRTINSFSSEPQGSGPIAKWATALPQKAILSLLEANRGLDTEPLAVASGIKTQAKSESVPYLIHEDSTTSVKG